MCCAMRMKTIAAWLFVGVGLLILTRFLSMFDLTEDGKLVTFLTVVGIVYFGIGFVSGFVHDWHMDKRTQAGREPHR